MQISKKRTMATVIALFLTLAIAVPLAVLPAANAQATMNTFPIVGAVPNPVGVGQETLVLTGLTRQTAWPQPGWYGVTVTVTKPDGTTETLGPVTTDTTGMTGIVYVPNTVGTYYLQTNFPQQVLNVTSAGVPAGTIMKASTSEKLALVVQAEPRQYYPGFPLPTEYWTRPIDAQFREWEPIAGNWLGVDSYERIPPQNDDAPETGHMLWSIPYAEGGLVGGIDTNAILTKAISYEHGDAYEGKWLGRVIMNGVLFFNRYSSSPTMATAFPVIGRSTPNETVVAVDLKTGEVLWEKMLGNNERLSFGQIFYWKTMNMYGAFSYLWTTVGTTWNAYDPLTGRWEYSISGVPSGTSVIGPNGEILRYSVSTSGGFMYMWNSTSAVWKTYYNYYLSRPGVPGQPGGGTANDAVLADYYAGRWRPQGFIFNGTVGIDWNVSIPTGLPGSVQGIIGRDRILGGNTGWSGGNPQPNPVFWAISIKPGQQGRLLFNESWKLPIADVHADIPDSQPISLEDNVFVVTIKETRQHYGFNLDTGKQIWGPTAMESFLNTFTNTYMNPWGQSKIAYGKLYTAGMGGVVFAYDAKTGKQLWRYNITDPYTEQLFSDEWPAPINIITDGKIYLFHQEHSGNTPLPRGAPAVALDAETGEEVWRVNGLRLGTRWGGQPIIGDSVIVGFSSYDNQIVAIGKGPSATTVSASPEVSVHGSSVLVKGTVTDVSPGTKSDVLAMRFPHGVPAVSDASMSAWMLYVYKQFPRPMDAVGVDVILSVLDPNGNVYDIGTATTDASGFYSFLWEPLVPGKYTIFATFAGSKGYYASFAETAIGVEEAPTATPPPTPPPAPMTDTYVTGFGIGIILAIVAVGLVIVLMLRKS